MVQKNDALLNTYKRMFELVDVFHFNSQNTRDVYERYLAIPESSAVVTITHKGVEDHRKVRTFDGNVLKLGFVGSEAPYKGLPMLKGVIARLNDEGFTDRIHLNVFGGRIGVDDKLSNLEYKGRFTSNQMESIYDSMDLLVVPSIWNETFGFTVIEAFQYGVPALVSKRVGAKDIVHMYSPNFIYETEEDLYQILLKLIGNKEDLKVYNKRLVDSPWLWSMENHSKEIVNILYCQK